MDACLHRLKSIFGPKINALSAVNVVQLAKIAEIDPRIYVTYCYLIHSKLFNKYAGYMQIYTQNCLLINNLSF